MKFIKNQINLISLLSSLVGLLLIYYAAISIEPQQMSIGDITADLEGRKVSVAGLLTDKRLHEDGHLFLTISDGSSDIQVPLFADFMRNLEQRGITEKDFLLKSKISVEGIIENYKGRLQIMPKNLDSIKILGE